MSMCPLNESIAAGYERLKNDCEYYLHNLTVGRYLRSSKSYALSALNKFKNNAFNPRNMFIMASIIYGIDNKLYSRKKIITTLCFMCVFQTLVFTNKVLAPNCYAIFHYMLKDVVPVTAHDIAQVFTRTQENKRILLEIFKHTESREIAEYLFGSDIIAQAEKEYNAIVFAQEINA